MHDARYERSTGRMGACLQAATSLRVLLLTAVMLTTVLWYQAAQAYTVEFCKSYADRAVQESSSADLSNAMRGTASDPGLTGMVGGSSASQDNSLSSVLGGLAQSQNQETLWKRTFDHCMGVSR